MIKRTLAVLLTVLLLASVFSGCSSDGSGEQIVFPIDNEPQYLDPQIVSDSGAANIIQNCFEGLLTYDADGRIVPAGCESYEVSVNRLVYTFKLRKDAKWLVPRAARTLFEEDELKSFDTSVKAADYVFTFRRLADSDTGSQYAELIMNIKNAKKVNKKQLSAENLGVYAKDDYTLVIELETPDADFPAVLTYPACVPCNEKFFEMTKGRYCLSQTYIISNGPFYISNWTDGTAITAKKNDEYHSASLVMPSSVYFSFNNEKNARGDKVENGTYEVSPVSNAQAKVLSNKKGITVLGFDNSCYSFLFNCSDELLQNKYLRLALAYSLEKSQFISGTGNKAADGIVPDTCIAAGAAFRKRVALPKQIEENVNIASKYFSSFQKTTGLDTVELKVLCDSDNELNVRKVMQKWQQVFGVKCSITVEVADEVTLGSRIKSGDYQLAFSDVSFSGDTALNVLSTFSSSGKSNFSFFISKEYDKLVEKLGSANGEREFLTALQGCEQFLLNSAVLVPIYKSQGNFALAKGVSGVVFSPGGEYVYFKSAVKK